MIVEVDPDDPTPVYEQLRGQVARMVVAGTLAPGTRLPAIRQLATDLGLAKGTVARAYELLLRDGYVEAGGRRGTLVRRRPAEVATADRQQADEELARLARHLAVAARQAGADRAAVHAAVDAALDVAGLDPSPEPTDPGTHPGR